MEKNGCWNDYNSSFHKDDILIYSAGFLTSYEILGSRSCKQKFSDNCRSGANMCVGQTESTAIK